VCLRVNIPWQRQSRGIAMNRDIIEGNWKQVKGRIKAQWGKLTDDDLDEAAGNYEVLCGRIQKAYGLSREETEKKLKDFN
jgi:uncharacterized protein YjbJ (UPF0337 family)